MKSKKVEFSRYNLFVLILFILYHHGEAMESRGWNQMITAFQAATQQCNYITEGTDWALKAAAAQTCDEVFKALDQFGLNICHGWFKAKCRYVPGYPLYQCTVRTPESCALLDSMQTPKTVFDCAPGLQTAGQADRISRGKGKEPASEPRKNRNTGERSPPRTGGSSYAGGSSTTRGSPPRGSPPRGSPLPTGSPFPTGFSLPGSPFYPTDPPSSVPGLALDPSFDVSSYGVADSPPGSPRYAPYPQTTPPYGLAIDPFFRVEDLDEADPSLYYSNPRGESLNSGPAGGDGTGAAASAADSAEEEAQGQTKHQCPECGGCFKHANSLRQHVSMHEAMRQGRTTCHCGVVFTTTQALKTHLKSVHKVQFETGPKSYVCDVCGLDFGNTKKLSAHKPTHTGETNCFVCGHPYKTISARNKHIKKKHPEVDF